MAGDCGKPPGIVAGDEGCEPNAKGLEVVLVGAVNEKEGVVCPKGVEGVAAAGVVCAGAPNGFDVGVDGA